VGYLFRIDFTNIDVTQYKNRTCIVPICVDDGYNGIHDGPKFTGALTHLASLFEKVIVIKCDTLQRTTLMQRSGCNEEEACESVKAAGEKWEARYNDTFEKLQNVEIQAWDQWLGHTDYKDQYTFLEQKYLSGKRLEEGYKDSKPLKGKQHLNEKQPSDIGFYKLIRRIAIKKAALLSDQIKDDDFSADHSVVKNVKYILEECAIFLLWQNNGYQHLFYPRHNNELRAKLHQYLTDFSENGKLEFLPSTLNKQKQKGMSQPRPIPPISKKTAENMPFYNQRRSEGNPYNSYDDSGKDFMMFKAAWSALLSNICIDPSKMSPQEEKQFISILRRVNSVSKSPSPDVLKRVSSVVDRRSPSPEISVPH